MTPKQERFVQEYLIDLNATQAAIRAGYKGDANTVGPRLLVNVGIRSAIDEAMLERSKRTEIDADYVLRTIQETVERCKQARPVLDRKGEPVWIEAEDGKFAPAYEFEPMAVLKGAELLGKHLKMFTDRLEHSGRLTLSDISDDALAAIATAGRS